MFFRQIEDFEENFKFLDRLNCLLFNIWRDRSAEAYHDGEISQVEMLYRTYISDMREKSNELQMLKNQIDEQLEELKVVQKEIKKISDEAEINNCIIATIEGTDEPTDDKDYENDDNENTESDYETEKTEKRILIKKEDIDNISDIAEQNFDIYNAKITHKETL